MRGFPQSSLQLTQSKSEASTFHTAHTSSKKLSLRYNVNTSTAPGQTATDATPPTHVQRPQGSALTAPVPSVVLPVQAPAASAPHVIPPADPKLFVGGTQYAAVVRQAFSPQAAHGRGSGGASGVGQMRQGNFVTLPRHTPLGPRPPPGFPALHQVRDAPMAELASPSRDEPASVSTPSAPCVGGGPLGYGAWHNGPH